MKLSFYILFLFSILFQGSTSKLEGKYKLEYNNRNLPSYIVTFNDSMYFKKSTKSISTTKGKIEYYKRIVTMSDENSNLIIDFFKDDIKKDTIPFGTKDLNGKGNYLDISINSGKLIKIKE